ncbi:MAG: arginine--tRNA ligase [Candidatus Parcubacteria bacterium]|nr:MAG: arginine--tRNA ligase [Candidatus Parcubacteria bacterium]
MNLYLLEQKLKNLIRKEIDKEKAEKILQKLKVFLIDDEKLGDYSTNLIFLLKQFAPEKEKIIIDKIKHRFTQISKRINADNNPHKSVLNPRKSLVFKKIEIVNNYLNFWLSDYQLLKTFRAIYKNKEKFFQQNYGRKQKLNIDYVSANPTGPLTLGNARGAVLGDTLANILKLAGFRVTREYYVNDRGNQIEILAKTVLAHLGYLDWESNFYQGEYLKEIAEKLSEEIKTILNQHESVILEKIGKKVADYILKNLIKQALKNFGTNFDWYFFETDLYKKNLDKRVLRIFERKKLIENRDGALFLLLTKLGEDKDEVLIKQNGEPTYFFSDILHYYHKFFLKKNKIEILIVASDHLDHTRRLRAALKIFGIKDYQFLPIVYQFVHLKKGQEYLRMSKRRGVFITLQDLIDEIDSGVVRFFFLQKSPEAMIEFDLDLAKKESEENPYWYIQYACARLNSILEKGRELTRIKSELTRIIDAQKVFLSIKDIDSAKIILRKVHQLQDLIYLIYKEKRPHLLTDYLIDLAKKIHSFYEKERILPGNNIRLNPNDNNPRKSVLNPRKSVDYKNRRESVAYKIAFVYFLREFLGFALSLINIKPIKKL